MVLQVDLFGPLRARTPTGALTARDFSGVKPKQLLELLVLERGHVVTKSRLSDLLWGGVPPKNHIATLETYVSVLRQALEPGVRARDSVVATAHGGYFLAAGHVEVDLDLFDELVASSSGVEPGLALARLDEALRLARGEVLEDEPYAEWAEEVRVQYRGRRVNALIRAARLALLVGDAPSAYARAEQAVALNPLAEAAYQLLMTSSYAMWRQDDALQAFERCRRLLADELGADPADETVALHLAILRQEDVAGLLPREEPAPPRVRSLPAGPLPLLGRDRELEQLQQAMRSAADGSFRLAMVCGDAGIGKTRLVEAFVDTAPVPVGSTRCSDLERDLPYVALSLAVRPLTSGSSLPVLGGLLQRLERPGDFDEFERLRTMEEVAGVLEQLAPFVLVLDDAQWADRESIRSLAYLQQRCRTSPILAVVLCTAAAARKEPLRGLRPDLRIELGPLTEADVAPLGHPELHAVTGGHPLFVDGWLTARARGLSEPFPAELRDLVVSTCWDLGPHSYQLLSVLAAVEGSVPPEALAALLDVDVRAVAEELDRLVTERYLVSNGSDVTFRSAAVRSILHDTMTPARRFLLAQQKTALVTGSLRVAEPPRRNWGA